MTKQQIKKLIEALEQSIIYRQELIDEEKKQIKPRIEYLEHDEGFIRGLKEAISYI